MLLFCILSHDASRYIPNMTRDEAIAKLVTLRPGEQFVYFSGHLAAHREMDSKSSETAVANVAYDLCLKGKVLLTQKRIGPPMAGQIQNWTSGVGVGFDYIATGATPRIQPLVASVLRGVYMT